jgi:hypothetical protein
MTTPFLMRPRVLCWLSFIGLVVSVFLHCISFFNFRWPVESNTLMILVTLGIFILIPRMLMGEEKEVFRFLVQKWSLSSPPTSRILKVVMQLLFLYLLVNAVYFLVTAKGNDLREQNGHFVLKQPSGEMKEISKNEYVRLMNHDLRGTTAAFLLYYYIPASTFYIRRKKNK